MPDDFYAGPMTRRDVLTGALALGVLPAAGRARRAVIRLAQRHCGGFRRRYSQLVQARPSAPCWRFLQATPVTGIAKPSFTFWIAPHANWWFLPWHRGYLFHFEEICRDLCGAPEFALPYWDWTSSPRVPDALFDDVLTPTHELYEESFATFRRKFGKAINDQWNNLAAEQRDQLVTRGFASVGDLWLNLKATFRSATKPASRRRISPSCQIGQGRRSAPSG